MIKLYIFLYKHISSNKIKKFLEKKIANNTGGFAYSSEIREIYKNYRGLEIGYGTYGGCWCNSVLWWSNISIGRYCSFAGNFSAFTRNHPLHLFTTHPVTYSDNYANDCANMLYSEPSPKQLVIGNDVWVGNNVVITASCHKVGDGAVIGAGAIVTKDVPPYAIVVGNPARILRYRFDEKVIKELQKSQWWNLDKLELCKEQQKFQEIIENHVD